MPKTKFESVVFTLIMVFCMVFCMTCYTVAMKMGALTPLAFLCFPVALCLQVFFVGPLVRLIFRTLFRRA